MRLSDVGGASRRDAPGSGRRHRGAPAVERRQQRRVSGDTSARFPADVVAVVTSRASSQCELLVPENGSAASRAAGFVSACLVRLYEDEEFLADLDDLAADGGIFEADPEGGATSCGERDTGGGVFVPPGEMALVVRGEDPDVEIVFGMDLGAREIARSAQMLVAIRAAFHGAPAFVEEQLEYLEDIEE